MRQCSRTTHRLAVQIEKVQATIGRAEQALKAKRAANSKVALLALVVLSAIYLVWIVMGWSHPLQSVEGM